MYRHSVKHEKGRTEIVVLQTKSKKVVLSMVDYDLNDKIDKISAVTMTPEIAVEFGKVLFNAAEDIRVTEMLDAAGLNLKWNT